MQIESTEEAGRLCVEGFRVSVLVRKSEIRGGTAYAGMGQPQGAMNIRVDGFMHAPFVFVFVALDWTRFV